MHVSFRSILLFFSFLGNEIRFVCVLFQFLLVKKI